MSRLHLPLLRDPLVDSFARKIRYLRVSVTDRCNYRCAYYMPEELEDRMQFQPRSALLTFEELERVIGVFAGLGVRKVRLTGGEPTVRNGIVELVQRVARVPGIEQVVMTTNGHLLAELSPVRLPQLPTPPGDPERIDATPYVGTYSCDIADLVVTQDDDGRIWLDHIPKGMAKEFGETRIQTEIVHFRDTTLIAKEPSDGMHRIRAFLAPDATGHATYLHTGRALVYTGS